ncbi:SIR2 family NAD-dependent protein deacylase [Pelotomaculum propionicicum]|uniref:SIR2 family NAD-dependent protein deacylase n=1 Tax=Pelotomaculum propionicicum TaxID=258475 RepID=UPI003B7BC6B0
MHYSEKINCLAGFIKKSAHTLALTGAGISTESGIPDFRSPGTGLWTKFDPIKVATVSALKRDPAAFYEINLDRWTRYTGVEPNAAHYALARLESEGLLQGVITQNIDGLHRKAGSKQLWEVHGHLRTCHCMGCKESYPLDFLVNQFNDGTNPPRCKRCGGVLRLDVVLFEDPLGEDFTGAVYAMNKCRLLIVVGSSLQVYPVASLPERARQLVIINKEPTPWDDRADLVINDMAGSVLTDVLAALEKL